MWSQFKKAHVGQRFGAAFLNERRCPTEEEMSDFLKFCASEMKDIYEEKVTVCTDRQGLRHTPNFVYEGPLTEDEMTEAELIREFFTSTSQSVATAVKFDAIRSSMREYAAHTTQTLNGASVYSKAAADQEVLQQLFGKSKRMFEPESFIDEATGACHFRSFLERRKQYEDVKQTKFLRSQKR